MSNVNLNTGDSSIHVLYAELCAAPPLVVTITLSSITPSSVSTKRRCGTNRKSNSRPLPVWHSWPEPPSWQTLWSVVPPLGVNIRGTAAQNRGVHLNLIHVLFPKAHWMTRHWRCETAGTEKIPTDHRPSRTIHIHTYTIWTRLLIQVSWSGGGLLNADVANLFSFEIFYFHCFSMYIYFVVKSYYIYTFIICHLACIHCTGNKQKTYRSPSLFVSVITNIFIIPVQPYRMNLNLNKEISP